jgi:hypothetical protein
MPTTLDSCSPVTNRKSSGHSSKSFISVWLGLLKIVVSPS